MSENVSNVCNLPDSQCPLNLSCNRQDTQSWFQYPLKMPADQFNSRIDENLLQIFKKIKQVPNLFDLLCDSIFPDLCGNLQIKKALVLALFGGTAKYDKECPVICARDHIHVLILGNRCSQKNRFLKCLTLMKNSCYIVGNCSSVKLIATRSCKKGKTEKGALICQEREIVCIDELEKMDNIQQQIVIQSIEHKKIGVKDLNEFLFYQSNVSIVAAANLNQSEYDHSKSIEKNIRVSLDLISKFDLVFLIDESSKQYDELVYDKEMKRCCNISEPVVEMDDNMTQLMALDTGVFGEKIFQDDNLLSLQIIFKYVSYCFDYVHPVINIEIKNVLQDFCLTQITSTIMSKLRIFETLCRLVEAHAKLFMRQEVTEDDLLAIVDVVQSSLTFIQLQTPVITKCKPQQKLKPALMYKLLSEASKYYQKKKFTLEEIVEICLLYIDSNLDSKQIQDMIYYLNDQALILKRQNFFEIM